MGNDQGDRDAHAFTVGVTGGFFDAHLRFDDDRERDLREGLLLGVLTWRATPDLSLGLAAGAVTGGLLRDGAARHDVQPGAHVSLQAAWTLLRAPEAPLSLSLSLALAAAFARTRDDATGARAALTATDLRLGLTASRTIADVVTPYASVRAFGGPVFWDAGAGNITGSDTKHVQLAAGIGLSPVPRLHIGLDWAFFGETGFTGSIAVDL